MKKGLALLLCAAMAGLGLSGSLLAREARQPVRFELAKPMPSEDGHALWLRYPAPTATREPLSIRIMDVQSPTVSAAVSELDRGLAGRVPHIVIARASDPLVKAHATPTADLGAEGYLVRAIDLGGRRTVLIAANGDPGLLYGTFALLRYLNQGGAAATVDLMSAPRVKLRILDHWDNLDGTVERGYAGRSLWDWGTLPEYKDPLYTDYARANASLGINGTVLNNVNARAESLTAPYIAKAAALADIFRPWGIRVYLSVRFSAPVEIGGLKSADPLDPAVRAWWAAKADEIYRAIPDFGGFLVKANSEGQPGPRDYGRTQADGANMLAAALKPHEGTVMWRAFVYSETNPEDRAKQAWTTFKPLDGKFAANVLLQVKNGAIDFQPREPFHPLFGAMPGTPLMLELQVTKEYLGQGTSLTYLGPLYEEVLRADTSGAGKGPAVASVIDGAADGHALSGMAGVANTGRSRDWSGSTFNQANWYAFGRLAWDPTLSAERIAREWAAQTFSPDPAVIDPVVAMMMASREAVVDYTGALGLAHLMGTGHHYGPAPWVSELGRPEWNPVYYHRADKAGIGFDRTASGSDAIAQYAPALAARLADSATTPENELLWFHHLRWDYRMKDGRTLWQALVAHYDRGVATVRDMRRQWAALKDKVDPERWTKTDALLAVEDRDATLWRDASLAYWMSVNGLALPPGVAPPAHDLDWYKAQHYPHAGTD